MRDIIDERNEKERIKKSIVKFWNVNYVIPQVEEEEDEAAKVLERLAKEAAEDEAKKQREIEQALEEFRRREEYYNETTGSYSGSYGMGEVADEVTKGQIDRILQEKEDAIRDIVENRGDYYWEE